MFFKNTLLVFKTYQSAINRNICCQKWKPTSSLLKILDWNTCKVNLKLHSAATVCSQKTNEKPQYKVKKIVTEDGIVKVQKKINIPRITLFTSENGMEILTMDEAKKIANRRNLKLIQVSDTDPKTDRPIYKLSSSASIETTKNKVDKNKNIKDEKILSINYNISDHDLQSKLKSILKWLNKGHTIKTSISGDLKNPAPAEKIFNILNEGVVNVGRIVQKNSKHGEIKFQIIQPKKSIKKESVTNIEVPVESSDEQK